MLGLLIYWYWFILICNMKMFSYFMNYILIILSVIYWNMGQWHSFLSRYVILSKNTLQIKATVCSFVYLGDFGAPSKYITVSRYCKKGAYSCFNVLQDMLFYIYANNTAVVQVPWQHIVNRWLTIQRHCEGRRGERWTNKQKSRIDEHT